MNNMQMKFHQFVTDDYSMEICDYVPEPHMGSGQPKLNEGSNHTFRSYGKCSLNSLNSAINPRKPWILTDFPLRRACGQTGQGLRF